SMTIDDVQHYSEEEKATIIASYPPHVNWKREQRAFRCWARAASFLFPNTRWPSSIVNFQAIGPRSAAWISAGITENPPIKGSNAHYSRRGAAQWGQGVAVDVATRRPTRDVGGGRRCPRSAIQSPRPQHAARARAVRRRQRLG